MAKTIIHTPDAPAPIGPYSQAVLAGNGTLYVSGQIALHPVTGELVSSSIADETRQVMNNIGAILKAAGYTFDDVVKCSIFLSTLFAFPVVNEVYGEFFTGEPPARETVEVARLPRDVNVEISVIAVK